jgi:hypothetical protein
VKKILKNHNYMYSFIFLLSFIITIILSYNLNLNITSLYNICSIFLTGGITFTSVWVSGYFLLIQFYKNRYPIKLLQKYLLNDIILIMILSLINFSFGAFVLIWATNGVWGIFYVLFSISLIGYVLLFLININKTLMINTYIEKYVEKIELDIKNRIQNDIDIDKLFLEIYNIFEECIEKNEYYVCKYISLKLNELFNELIKHTNSIKLENKTDFNIDYFYDSIIKNSLKQISYINTRKIDSMIGYILRNVYENMITCIKIEKFSIFKKYVDELNLLIYRERDVNDGKLINELFVRYNRIIDYLFINKITFEWIKYILKESMSLTSSISFLNKNCNLVLMNKLFINALIKSFDDKEDETYKLVFEMFQQFSYISSKTETNFSNIIPYHFQYFTQLVNAKNIDRIYKYLEIAELFRNYKSADSEWLYFYDYILYELGTKYKSELGNFVRKKQVEGVMHKINSKEYNDTLILPDYIKIINENKADQILINEIQEEYMMLTNRSIHKESTSVCHLLLDRLNEILTSLSKNDTSIQKTFFEIYFDLLLINSQSQNKLYFELTLSKLKELIKKLDKENKISKQISHLLIDKLGQVASGNMLPNDDFSPSIVRFLFDFMKKDNELKFVLSEYDTKSFLYKSIYYIGVNSIEINNIKTLKVVSNVIGWLIKYSMDRVDIQIGNCLIDYARKLYSLSIKMKIDEQTTTFLSTLFAIIGPYSLTDIRFSAFKAKLVESSKFINTETFKIALELRKTDSELWQSMFKNKQNYYNCEFLKLLSSE